MLQQALAFSNTDKHQCYGWINLEDGEVYSNLKLNDETAVMPTEEEVNAKIAELQVIQARQEAYGSITDQLDMMYKDKINGTTTWEDHIAEVKTDNPKPSE